MPKDNRLLDDLARVAGGAASLLSTVGKQVQSEVMGRMGADYANAEPSSRDDVARLNGMISQFRIEQEQLKKRVAELEALVLGKAANAPRAKPAAPKAAAPKSKSAASKAAKPAAKKTSAPKSSAKASSRRK